MKINFQINKEKYAEFCINCMSDNLLKQKQNTGHQYVCGNCGQPSDRALIIDPKLDWHLDENNEYIHNSVGVFILNKGRILVFKRTKFPFGYTAPAGHVDKNELPENTAIREAKEETGMTISKPELIFEGKIVGDSCRRGSDVHYWNAYKIAVEDVHDLNIAADEGSLPQWVTYDELLGLEVPPAMKFLLNNIDTRVFLSS